MMLLGPPPPTPPARVQVVAKEYSLSLSRIVLRHGTAIVQLANFGEDPHDLRLQRMGGTRIYGVPTTQSGEQTDLRARLLAGRYTLWCSLADHRARGMVAHLTVR
ncbi:MAG: hypothetical protein ACR2MU_04340 [Gaiellaceae bacterium]